jgi:hypothetical protein
MSDFGTQRTRNDGICEVVMVELLRYATHTKFGNIYMGDFGTQHTRKEMYEVSVRNVHETMECVKCFGTQRTRNGGDSGGRNTSNR